MAKFRSKHRFDHSAEEIFELMNDIEAHADFLPLCKRSRVVSTDTSEESIETSMVRYVLAYQRYAFRKTLDFAVRSDFDNLTMTLKGVGSDARATNMAMHVKPSSDGGCEVSVDCDYRLTDLTMAMADKSGLLGKAFEKIMQAMDQQVRRQLAS